MRGRRGWRSACLTAVALCASALSLYAVAPAPVLPAEAGAATSAPSATVVIRAGASAQFSPQVVALTGGGSVNVVNLDTIDHTFTSQAVDAAGRPLFDVRVPSGSTVTVSATALLADGSYGFFCTFHPNMRGTLVVSGSDGTVDPQLPDFEQPLVVPPVVRGERIRLEMREAGVRVLPRGRRTPMWTYEGSWPGPTIRRPAGADTWVTFANQLPKAAGATSVHLHGDHHAPEDDGQPTTFLVRRGGERTYHYPLTFGGEPEPASFFFYHDHRMDHTARNKA